jgi:hypothetical protein
MNRYDERAWRDALARLRHGQHVCLFYDTADEQLTVSGEYLARGLARGDRCLYVSDGSMIDRLRRSLEQGGVDVTAALDRRALVMLTKDEAYLKGGRFDVEGMVTMLGQTVQQALDDGFAGLTAAGDMAWILDEERGPDEAIEYEALMNEFYARSPALGLCLYDRRRLDPLALEGALRTHPAVLVGHACFDANPFYETPEIFFGRVDPRERFEWKLRQVRARVLSERRHA